MVFYSLNVANNSDNFGAQMSERPSRFLADNKTFDGIFLASLGKFLQKL